MIFLIKNNNMTTTYKQSYDKIIDAYFKNEIRPYEATFCFCGTLSGSNAWDHADYNRQDMRNMEAALLSTIRRETVGLQGDIVLSEDRSVDEGVTAYYDYAQVGGLTYLEQLEHPNYENALFNGMCAALDVLKQIHIEAGEQIDQNINLKKRQLV